MSVAVACNLSDGVILGVDSAVTVGVPGSPGVAAKVYENADKLFQLGELPIGVAVYGIATLGTRTIGSFLREFECCNKALLEGSGSVSDVVEALRAFFMERYRQVLVPALEKEHGKPFADIPQDRRPPLGLVVGGFSQGQYLSEVWNITVPVHENSRSAQQVREPGNFGSQWFALFGPIQRYIKGIDEALLGGLARYFEQKLGRPLDGTEQADIQTLVAKFEYRIPFASMPLPEGIAHTRFLIELVINHHRFAVGAPVVGGKAKLGMVTYRGATFELLDV